MPSDRLMRTSKNTLSVITAWSGESRVLDGAKLSVAARAEDAGRNRCGAVKAVAVERSTFRRVDDCRGEEEDDDEERTSSSLDC